MNAPSAFKPSTSYRVCNETGRQAPRNTPSTINLDSFLNQLTWSEVGGQLEVGNGEVSNHHSRVLKALSTYCGPSRLSHMDQEVDS